jgi:hypothetical protein
MADIWWFICDECGEGFSTPTDGGWYELFHGYNPIEECPSCGHLTEAKGDLSDIARDKNKTRWEHGC